MNYISIIIALTFSTPLFAKNKCIFSDYTRGLDYRKHTSPYPAFAKKDFLMSYVTNEQLGGFNALSRLLRSREFGYRIASEVVDRSSGSVVYIFEKKQLAYHVSGSFRNRLQLNGVGCQAKHRIYIRMKSERDRFIDSIDNTILLKHGKVSRDRVYNTYFYPVRSIKLEELSKGSILSPLDTSYRAVGWKECPLHSNIATDGRENKNIKIPTYLTDGIGNSTCEFVCHDNRPYLSYNRSLDREGNRDMHSFCKKWYCQFSCVNSSRLLNQGKAF